MYRLCTTRRRQCRLICICVGGFLLITLLFYQNECAVKSEVQIKTVVTSASPVFVRNSLSIVSPVQKPTVHLETVDPYSYTNAATSVPEIVDLKSDSAKRHPTLNLEQKNDVRAPDQDPKKRGNGSDRNHQKRRANIPPAVEAMLEHGTKHLKKLVDGWIPPLNAGEGGAAVKMDVNQVSQDQRQRVEEGQTQHGFNQFLSSHISLNRSLPNITHPQCDRHQYAVSGLPQATVVVVFHNEAWSTLLRTVHSVLNRSPTSLLHKVILVDDFSDLEHLKKPLDDYVSRVLGPVVTVKRSASRDGIVAARLLGLNDVTTPVVVYMDAHCEVVEGWLEPLLDRIAKNSTTVAVPVIDIINSDDFGYQLTDARHIPVGTFNWRLIFGWMKIPLAERQRRRSDFEPIRTSTMCGGIFAIDKNYFLKLGAYDPGMRIWGGENLELSFKAWMCGGSLEIVPCSHVGHVFRESVKDPVRKQSGMLDSNLYRLAEVWMDDYRYYSQQARGWNQTNVTGIGDVSQRQALRRHLQCHSFAWYLRNVIPDLYLPADLLAHGPIRSEVWDLCISTSLQNYRQTHLLKCRDNEFSQQWSMNQGQLTVFQESYFQGFVCLDYHGNGTIRTLQCNETQTSQLWTYSQEQKQLIHTDTGLCAQLSTDPDPDSPYTPHTAPSNPHLLLAPCHHGNRRQQWRWNTTAVAGPSWRKDLAAGRPVL